MILRHNASHPEDPMPLPQWITESPDNYATLKRPLPESKTERIYIFHMDNRCNPWDEPTIYDTNRLSFKIQVPNPQAQSKETTSFPSPPSTILKKNNIVSDSTRHHHVHADRLRNHHLHRRQTNMGATRKRTARKKPILLHHHQKPCQPQQ